MTKKIPIEISARHIHLSSAHVEELFGRGAILSAAHAITQPHQFVAHERVILRGPKVEIKNVAIVGPVRGETQVEISQTDAITLGLRNIPLVLSGKHNETAGGITLVGPHGSVTLDYGVMIAKRHLHVSPQEAKRLGIKHGDSIAIKTNGKRSLTFYDVAVRSRDDIDTLAFHIDTDEANAAGLSHGETGELLIP